MQTNVTVPVKSTVLHDPSPHRWHRFRIMGGLSMPNVPIKVEQIQAVIGRHPVKVIGVVSCIC